MSNDDYLYKNTETSEIVNDTMQKLNNNPILAARIVEAIKRRQTIKKVIKIINNR